MNEQEFVPSQPDQMSFSFLEWVWAFFALICFWNKQFRAPYQGLSARKAAILMRVRGERPVASDDVATMDTSEPDQPLDDFESEDCGHPECKEIAARLEVISKTHSYAEYEEALYTLGYCAPRHWDEADYGDMPADAGKWIDPHTMPYTAQRWRWQQQEAREAERHALEEEQLEEVRREMEEDRRRDEYCLELWQKLTAEAEKRPLSKEEKRDIHFCELNFGGREKLIEHRDRFAEQHP